MISKRFLNVLYENYPARIDTKDMEVFSQIQEEVESWYSKDYPHVTSLRVQLWNKNDTPHIQLNDFDDIKALPEEYYWKSNEPGALFLTVQLLAPRHSASRQPSNTETRAAPKRPRLYDQNITNRVKKGPFVSQNLVDTSGADFVYSDRIDSMKELADWSEKRHIAWKHGKKDRNLHPIPLLADGPGSGKSRFLQELPSSFINFVQQGAYSQEFKDVFKSPVCFNITFSNGSRYSLREAQAISIKRSVCLRILYEFETEYSDFGSFYDAHKSQELSISGVLSRLDFNASCIILGIDDLSQIYKIGEQVKEIHKDAMRKRLKVLGLENHTAMIKELNRIKDYLLPGLLSLVSSISCAFFPFVITVLAGTVIGPIKSAMVNCTYVPLHIPLPLLSYESCLSIFAKKNIQLLQESPELRQLISDCGGHGRSLEILFDGILEIKPNSHSCWNDVTAYVRHWLYERYEISDIPLGAAIALSFLRRPVQPKDSYPDNTSLNFQDLEEKGLIKLEKGIIRMPYFFVSTFLISRTTEYSKFWRMLLIEKDFWWQDWKVFNRNYIAFRLSLFAYLGETSVSLKEFFAGAKMNIPFDIDIKIPPLETLKLSKIAYCYPSTMAPTFDIGHNVLNGDDAPFSSFLYLETASNPMLFAFQMKSAKQDSKTQKVISDKSVNDEFNKINNAVSKHLPGTDFVAIILGQGSGTFSENELPSNCVVVSKEEHMNFYGESFYHRLNNSA